MTRLDRPVQMAETGGEEPHYLPTVTTPRRVTVWHAFVPSVTDAYVLEFGHLYLRVYKNGRPIQSGGDPVQIATPYTAAQLQGLHPVQHNDVLFLVHPAHATRRLSRLSDTEWDLRVSADVEDGQC